jgi:hypothetical protein
MTLEELKSAVPGDQHEAMDALIEEIKTGANPLAGLDDKGVSAFVDGNPLLKSHRDQFFQKGLTSWQDGNLDKLKSDYYNERFEKENPAETPEQKELRELKEKFDASERKSERADMKAEAIQTLTQEGLPTTMADILVGSTAEETSANMGLFKKVLETYGTGIKDEILKEHTRNPRTSEDDTENYYTVDQLNNMSPEEYGRNEEKVNLSLSYHQNR